MRKIIIALVMLCIPCLVLADSASPSIMGYEAVVINKKGAKYEDGDGKKTIAYNKKLFVRNEYSDGKVDACLDSGDSGTCFEISIKDIAPIKKEIVPKDLQKKDNMGTTLEKHDAKLFVYEKNGIKLKKGPADIYGEYEQVVPFKEIMKVTYAIVYYDPDTSYSWYYVDNDNYKGWIHSGDVAIYYNEPIMMFEDVNFYNADTNEIIETIPSETIINEFYDSEKVFFTYKDNLGYIKSNFFDNDKDYYHSYYGYKSKLGYILTIKSLEMKSKGKTVTAIPKGEYIKILYAWQEYEDEEYDNLGTSSACISRDECLYYIEYNGVKGFVDDKNVISLYYNTKPKETSYSEDLKIYDASYYLDEFNELSEFQTPIEEYSKKHETMDVVPANTKVTVYMRDYLDDYSKEDKILSGNLRYKIDLIKYNNKVGWVIAKIEDTREFRNDNTISPEPVIIEPDNKGFVLSKSAELIITYIMYTLIASSIALGLLFLVNKKKKPKEKNIVKQDNNATNKEKEIVPEKKKEAITNNKEKGE